MFFGTQLNLFVVCTIVVLGRIIDMSLDVIRIAFSVKGKPQVAAPIAFIEVLLWFIVVKAALDYMPSAENLLAETLLLAVAYSLGYALGTFVGGLFTKFLIKTKVQAQIVLNKKDDKLIKTLNEHGFGQTVLTGFGGNNKTETYVILIQTDSKRVKELKSIVDSLEQKVFITINESKDVFNGYGIGK